MSIVTRTGDSGRTSLYCGKRVAKDDPRVELCGALDEASSFLGMAKSLIKDKKISALISHVQKDIIALNSQVATTGPAGNKLKKKIGPESVCFIEEQIDCLENRCNVRSRYFCLQGANTVSGALDVARAVVRRAERRCVTMTKKKMLDNRDIIVYLNRLSDLLYLLARFNDKKK